jgi:hypothetical protein
LALTARLFIHEEKTHPNSLVEMGRENVGAAFSSGGRSRLQSAVLRICTPSVYVLVAIIKKLQLDALLYTLLQILLVALFDKMPLQQEFPASEYILPEELRATN